jgi:O-Antigen ligase
MATAFDARELSATWIDTLRRRRLVILTAVVIGVSLGLAKLILAVNLVADAGLFIVVALIAVGLRPRYGLYLLLGNALLFDTGVNLDPLMLPAQYINTSLQKSLNINGAIFIPFEGLLLLTTIIWLAQASMRRQLDFRGGSLGRPVLLFTLALVFGVVRGTVAGGNFNYTFWESRFLFCMVLAYVLAANTIRTRAHVRTLLTIVFVCVGLSAIEGVWRKYALINAGLLGTSQELWYSHDGMVIWGMLIMLVLATQVFGGPRWRRLLGPFLAAVTMFAMLLSERRAGLVAVVIALAVFTLALWTIKRKAFILIALPVILAGAIYLPVFWNNTGTVGQLARTVRSLITPDPRDAASNAWRDLEAINVRSTILSDPLLGIGFGRPFLQVVTVPDISGFLFWDYEAHHDILWVWMKTGAFGFIGFFTLLLGAIARAIWLAKSLPHPELKTFAALAATAIVMSLVYCYVDLGLVESRIPMVLGVMLGTVGVLHRVGD